MGRAVEHSGSLQGAVLGSRAPTPARRLPANPSPPARSPHLLLLQAHRAVLPQLPCQVAACVSREELANVPWAVQEDARRSAKFMTFALTAAAEVTRGTGLGVGRHRRCPALLS